MNMLGLKKELKGLLLFDQLLGRMLQLGAKTVPQSWMFSSKGVALWPLVFIIVVHFFKRMGSVTGTHCSG